MLKLSKNSFLITAVLLSGVLATMLYSYLKVPTAGQSVIVANTDIPPKTVITENMIEETSVPKEYLQPNAIQDKNKVIGGIAREQIVAGEQIISHRLVTSEKLMGFTGLIPKDKRAMTVAVTEVTGVAGFTKPGDYVDVIVTIDDQSMGVLASQTILQNIQVLAANRELEEDTSGAPGKVANGTVKMNTVTLAVDPIQAVQLALGDEKGKLRLTLRPFHTSDDLIIPKMVTASDLLGRQTLPVQKDQYTEVYSPTPDTQSYTQYQPAVSNSIEMIRGTKVGTIPLN